MNISRTETEKTVVMTFRKGAFECGLATVWHSDCCTLAGREPCKSIVSRPSFPARCFFPHTCIIIIRTYYNIRVIRVCIFIKSSSRGKLGEYKTCPCVRDKKKKKIPTLNRIRRSKSSRLLKTFKSFHHRGG